MIRTLNFKKSTPSKIVMGTPENGKSQKTKRFTRREKSYHTSRQNHKSIYKKSSTSIDNPKTRTDRQIRRKKRTMHNGKSLHHIKSKVNLVGEEGQGMPNLSFRNPNQPYPQNTTSNYSNKLPKDFYLHQRNTVDNYRRSPNVKKLFNGKGKSYTNFNQSSVTGGFGNFIEKIPINQSVVIGNQRKNTYNKRMTLTSNNSLQRKMMTSESNQRFQHVSNRKLVSKKAKKKKGKKFKTTSLRYKNKEIDIYSFKKVYKNMTNDYPNLEVINFQNNVFKGNIANIIHDVIPKRRANPMTLDLRNNTFNHMSERDLQKFKEICRLKNVVVFL